jgi:hypothetical protein
MEQFKVIAIKKQDLLVSFNQSNISSIMDVAHKIDGNELTELHVSCILNSREDIKELMKFLKISENTFPYNEKGIGRIHDIRFNESDRSISVVGTKSAIRLKEDDLIELANSYIAK